MSMHRYLYEMYHDVKLNDNDMIVFLDGNKNNFVLIKKSIQDNSKYKRHYAFQQTTSC